MTTIPRRGVLELSFRSDRDYASPFADVEIIGEFTGPDGRALSHPGFYDGGGVWRLRFSPGLAGDWTYRVRSVPPNADLDEDGKFQVADSDARGFLRSVPGSSTGFRFENDQDIYLLGDTTYDLFGMDYCGGDVAGFVARRVAQGYTHLRIRVPVSRFHPPIGYCDWQVKRCWPWGGSEQAPRFDLFNLDWFRSVDRTVATIEASGLGIEMIMEAWGFEFPFSHRAWFTAAWERLWLRYLIARYDAYSSVWFWTPLNEYEYHNNGDWNWSESSDRWAMDIARWIKSTAAHGHPVAMHNGPPLPAFAERFRADPTAVDTIMFQSWGDRGAEEGWLASGIEGSVAESLAGWPGTAILAEWGYERDEVAPPLFPFFEYCDRNHNRRGGWRGAFSGLSIANGFEFTWSPSMILDRDMAGCLDLVHVRRFMTEFTSSGPVRPADLVEDGPKGGARPLALQGPAGIAVYFPAGGEAEARAPGDWTIRWFDPRNGSYFDGEIRRRSPERISLKSPGGEDEKSRPLDWVAWLQPAT